MALRSLARSWTAELKRRRIRSNVISPGPIDTPIIADQPADTMARMIAGVPLGRTGKAEEVARAALFLASDDASFTTGAELFVDGGSGQI